VKNKKVCENSKFFLAFSKKFVIFFESHDSQVMMQSLSRGRWKKRNHRLRRLHRFFLFF